MVHQGSFEVEGVVKESLPNTLFRVELSDGNIVLCHLSGKMRVNFIKILPGDKVRIEMTPYDKTKGRITYRETGRGSYGPPPLPPSPKAEETKKGS
ncbi:MAG: translation initiation factor IF-1 [Candidatus Levybacteria bacterium]|nr:translation initiation factor IF-1 [Candidatus Levybacteria bacterium]